MHNLLAIEHDKSPQQDYVPFSFSQLCWLQSAILSAKSEGKKVIHLSIVNMLKQNLATFSQILTYVIYCIQQKKKDHKTPKSPSPQSNELEKKLHQEIYLSAWVVILWHQEGEGQPCHSRHAIAMEKTQVLQGPQMNFPEIKGLDWLQGA